MSKPIIEERFFYKGYPCVVLFMPMAFRNGYVGLPKKSKFYKKDYDKIPICCHCGLTYGSSGLYGQTDKDTWWIGFDCARYGDGYDVEQAKEYYKNDKGALESLHRLRVLHETTNEYCSFKTFDYVKSECVSIVNQIIELESEE